MNNIGGISDMVNITESTLFIFSGEMQNISIGEIAVVYNIYNSSFNIFNVQISNMNSHLIYFSWGFIKIYNTSFRNSNSSSSLGNDFAIKIEYNSVFNISYCIFEALMKTVIYKLSCI